MPARILIVDDNRLNLKLAQLMVSVAGHEAQVAGDAGEALASIARSRPDLALVDLQMPGVDGLELTRRIRADRSLDRMAVVALTASVMAADRDRALGAGCDHLIRKPLDTRTFAAELAPFLPRSEMPAA